MFAPVSTKDPAAVEAEAQFACLDMFPTCDQMFVPQFFDWALQAFSGKYKDYQALDASYHDIEHTMQGTLCFIRLLVSRHRTGAQPPLTKSMFQLGLLAILLHDTGYLKKRDDTKGTGAKYTVTHVGRSADFATELMRDKGFQEPEIMAVRNMISCTGVDSPFEGIHFQTELERVVGAALASADLLGQMAAEDYVRKLPVLYGEFVEAVDFSGSHDHFIASFNSADDLMRRTPAFWQQHVVPKLDHDFCGVWKYLNQPFPHGTNAYMQRVQSNMDQLKSLTL